MKLVLLALSLVSFLASGCTFPSGKCTTSEGGVELGCGEDTAPSSDTAVNTDDPDGDASGGIGDSDSDETGIVPLADVDADGYTEDVDCNDNNATVHPDAAESCNDIDDDCDGSVDEGVSPTWYADGDSDGYGDPATAANACHAPVGYVLDGTDCNDASAAVNPAMTEVCNGVDDNCIDGVDEAGADGENTWYADADGDGYGDAATAADACAAPFGYVANSSDCNDADVTVYPDAYDIAGDGVDRDCDGWDGIADVDGDGYARDVDCDDTRNWAYPGASEVCWQGVDADCDGVSGECWGGLTGPNLFEGMALWDMENPIGTGNVAGIVAVGTSAPATSDCTTMAMTDTCSAMLQGPGAWAIESSLSATADDDMFCFVSLLADASSVPVTVSVYSGGTLLESVSHDTGTAWGPVSEFGLVAPVSSGTVTIEITVASANAVRADAVVCQQRP